MPQNSLFGCPECFQADAPAAWRAMRQFRRLALLVDESHFGIHLLQCPGCGQRCVKVFTETIDWQDGDDPQYWSVVPVTPAEAEELIAQGEQVDTHRIETISQNRCYLQADYPRKGTERILWSEGPLLIGPHD